MRCFAVWGKEKGRYFTAVNDTEQKKNPRIVKKISLPPPQSFLPSFFVFMCSSLFIESHHKNSPQWKWLLKDIGILDASSLVKLKWNIKQAIQGDTQLWQWSTQAPTIHYLTAASAAADRAADIRQTSLVGRSFTKSLVHKGLIVVHLLFWYVNLDTSFCAHFCPLASSTFCVWTLPTRVWTITTACSSTPILQITSSKLIHKKRFALYIFQ